MCVDGAIQSKALKITLYGSPGAACIDYGINCFLAYNIRLGLV